MRLRSCFWAIGLAAAAVAAPPPSSGLRSGSGSSSGSGSGSKPNHALLPQTPSNDAEQTASSAANSGTARSSGLALMPAGAWDSHAHVTDPDRYPPTATAEYAPGYHTVWDNAVFEQGLGCSGVVLVQPSVYGNNNTLLLDSLRALGPRRARGVIVFDDETNSNDNNATVSVPSQELLRSYHRIGVRGIRVNTQSKGKGVEGLGPVLRSLAEVARPLDWVLQLYIPLSALPTLVPVLKDLNVRIVMDHFGSPALPPSPATPAEAQAEVELDEKTEKHINVTEGQIIPDAETQDVVSAKVHRIAGFKALAELIREGNTWVKMSAPYRISQRPFDPEYHDLDNLIRELFRIAPKRIVYGFDWPHTRFEGLDIKPWTRHLLGLTGEDEELRRGLFVDNARELWKVERV